MRAARRHLPNGSLPPGFIRGERGPDQPGLVLQGQRQVGLQAPAERALGYEHERGKGEAEEGQRADDEPPAEGHRGRPPRSMLRNR